MMKTKKSNAVWAGGAGRMVAAAAAAAAGFLCGDARSGEVNAVATTGMVADVVREVGGDRVEVVQMMGPGVDPHIYKPTPSDVSALSKADIIFYNGLMLEGRMGDLFRRMERAGKPLLALAEQVPESRRLGSEEYAGQADPHVWFDVALWAETVPAVARALSGVDPGGAESYSANAERLLERLARLDAWCREVASELPPDRRVLVTSHDAFGYFGRAYGFEVVGLQGLSTVSEAALADVASLADFVREQGVPAIFVESSVNPGAIRRVAEDAGVAIGGELFSDAMGGDGEEIDGFPVGTYEGMIRYNLRTIVGALGPSGRPAETADP